MKAKLTLVDGVLVKVEGTASEIADLISALRRSRQLGQPADADAPSPARSGAIIDEVGSEEFSSDGDANVEVVNIPGVLDRKRNWGRHKTDDKDVDGAVIPTSPDPSEAPENEGPTLPTGPLDATTVNALADQFHMVADATRLRILSTLADGGHTVGEIRDALDGLSQSAVSRQLGLLRVSGMVTSRREGPSNSYELTDMGWTLVEAVSRFDSVEWRTSSDLFRQVSDPIRLQILSALAEGERSFSELCGDLGNQGASAVGDHLAMMRHDLIEARRDGEFRYYSLRESGEELVRVVGSLLEATGKEDPSRGEDSDDAEAAEFAEAAEDAVNDIPDGDEHQG